MRISPFSPVLCIASLLCVTSLGFRAQGQRVVTFDAPGADLQAGSYGGTYTSGINIDGTVVGEFLSKSKVYKGFLRDSDGKFTIIVAPGADETAGSFQGTQPSSINDLGEVTGFYTDSKGYSHGFIRMPGGKFTTFEPPNAGGYGSFPMAINLEGAVVGYYTDAGLNFHAFLRKPDGEFKTFVGPDACRTDPSEGCYGSATFAINLFGLSAGGFADASLVHHGLIRYANGDLVQFDAPGAGTGAGQGTGCPGCAPGLNDWDDIAGIFSDAKTVSHGYIRKADGSITTYDVSAAGKGEDQGTGCPSDCPVFLNDTGWITGTFVDSGYNYNGYIRNPDGKIEVLKVKGALLTQPWGINDGQIVVGQYVDAKLVYHGFLAFP